MSPQDTRSLCNRKVAGLALVGLLAVGVGSVNRQAQAGTEKPAQAALRKRALLVGISRYPQTGANPWRPLNTHQDVVAIKAALIAQGFAAEGVKILEDGEATAAGIRAAFRTHLIEPAQPGDTLLFHFSGHGQQVPDDNGDEVDGLDETLVPSNATDQRASEGAKTNIRDDELGVWLKALTDKLREPDGRLRGSVTVTLDSCFSGTATRGDLVERGHGWDEALDGPKPPMREVQRGAQPAGSLQDTQSDVQVLSATLSTQTAKERNGMGVFSYALVQALRRADRQTTYRALLEDIAYEVAQSGVREQTPSLEGNADLLLFRGEAREPEHATRVLEVTGDHLTLAAGQVHLVTVGSLYAVHRGGTAALSDATKLGEAEVMSVSPTQSVLRLRPGTKIPKDATARELLLKARVVETAHRYADNPLRVRFTGLSAEIEKTLRAIPVLTTQGTAGANYDVEVRAERNAISLYRPESKLRFAMVDVGAEAASRVDSVLRAEWRWRSLMNLRAADAAVQVKLRILPVQCPAGAVSKGQQLTVRTDVPRTEPLRLRAGDCFQLELANPTKNDLWVTVLQLSDDGSVESSFPHPRRSGDNLIPTGKTVRIPTPYLYKVELSADRKYERSAFKVIATMEPVDLSPLIQSAHEIAQAPLQNRGPARLGLNQRIGTAPPKLGPLLQLLIDTALGERKGVEFPSAIADWGVTATYLDQEEKP